MANHNGNLSQPTFWALRLCGIAVGLTLIAIVTGWAVQAEPDGEMTSPEPVETVELPVESLLLASDRLSLQDSLEIAASIILPDSCHSFDRLEGSVDEDSHTVTLVAVGGRQGEVCSQALETVETTLLMYPLPSEGVWAVEAQYFDETVRAEVTVIP